MMITALSITLLFAGLGLLTALFVAVHDAVEAWLERRSLRSIHNGGGGGMPLASTSPHRSGARPRPAPLPVISKQVPVADPVSRPAWLENAQRDIAHR